MYSCLQLDVVEQLEDVQHLDGHVLLHLGPWSVMQSDGNSFGGDVVLDRKLDI